MEEGPAEGSERGGEAGLRAPPPAKTTAAPRRPAGASQGLWRTPGARPGDVLPAPARVRRPTDLRLRENAHMLFKSRRPALRAASPKRSRSKAEARRHDLQEPPAPAARGRHLELRTRPFPSGRWPWVSCGPRCRAPCGSGPQGLAPGVGLDLRDVLRRPSRWGEPRGAACPSPGKRHRACANLPRLRLSTGARGRTC